MKSRLIPRSLLGIAIIAVLAGFWLQRDAVDFHLLDSWLRQMGWTAPVLFVALYASGTVVCFPAIFFTLLGGALFGPWWGALLSLLGATLGASSAFLIARYLAGNWLESKAGSRLQRLKQGVEDEGWRFVAFVRLVPLFPFVLLNYVLGLTRIPLSQYAITSLVCMAPGAVAYSWLGYVGKEAASGAENIIQQAFIALAFIATVAFLPRLVKAVSSD